MVFTEEARIEAEKVVKKATAAYVRRCHSADFDDMQQQSWLIAMQVWQQEDWVTIGIRKFGACVWVALMHRLAHYLRRQNSVVTLDYRTAENRPSPDGTRPNYEPVVKELVDDREHDSRRCAPHQHVAATPAAQEVVIDARAAAGRLRDSLLAAPGPVATMAVAVLCDGKAPEVVAAEHGVGYANVAHAVNYSVRRIMALEMGKKKPDKEVIAAVRALTA